MLLALLALGLRAPPPRLAASSERVTAGLQARIAALDPQACLLIDVENLRGLSGFRVSHGTVVTALACWAREWELTGRVVLAVDHGDEQCGFYVPQVGLAFVFAGPSEKADDVLVELVRRPGEEALVVTADRELRVRCRRATRRKLSIVSPLALLLVLFPSDALLPAAAALVAAGGGVSATDAADAAALPPHDFVASQRHERERRQEETALRRALPALTRLPGRQKWQGPAPQMPRVCSACAVRGGALPCIDAQLLRLLRPQDWSWGRGWGHSSFVHRSSCEGPPSL